MDIITQYGGFWNSAPGRYPSPIFVYYEYDGGYPQIHDWIGDAPLKKVSYGIDHWKNPYLFDIEKIDDEYYKCSKCGVVKDDIASCMNCDIELCWDCDENDMPFGADDHVYCTPCVEKLFTESDYIDLPLSDEEIKS